MPRAEGAVRSAGREISPSCLADRPGDASSEQPLALVTRLQPANLGAVALMWDTGVLALKAHLASRSSPGEQRSPLCSPCPTHHPDTRPRGWSGPSPTIYTGYLRATIDAGLGHQAPFRPMPSTIVVGGQYGSEGKGKVVATLAGSCAAPLVVRCGGPNSGHTIEWKLQPLVLRQLPSGAAHPNALLLIGAGAVIDVPVLLEEANKLDVPRDRVVIDPRACIVTDDDRLSEQLISKEIASTGTGTGAALIRRILRRPPFSLAADSSVLAARFRVECVAPMLHAAHARGESIIIEGTQGFGLSLLHGREYPYVTARDTTASGFASEVGLAPRLVDRVVLVVRTFPIRVGGDSGPLAQEVSWSEVKKLGGAPHEIPELTSVTRRIRRVALFDAEEVRRAVLYNAPTDLAIMGLDRLNYADLGVNRWHSLSRKSQDFVRDLEQTTSVRASLLGTGFGVKQIIAEVPHAD